MDTKLRGSGLRTIATVAALAVAFVGGTLGAGNSPAERLAAFDVSAQESTADARANHPIVGVWMVAAPTGPALAVFAADGTNIQGVPTAQAGPQGVTFTGAQVGTWEPTGPRSVHFTGVQLLTDATGAFVGSVTIDGHPRVSEDGQTIIDDAPETTVTIRDAANNVVEVIKPFPGAPPATGVRMAVGAPGFEAAAGTIATPAAEGSSSAAADLVRTTEHERLRALVDVDLETAGRLHADDFQLVNPAGGTLTKAEYLGGIESGEIDYLTFEPTSEVAVRLHGDAAIVRYQSQIHIVVGGEDIVTRGWHTDLYELRDGRWQAVWSQMTEIQ